MRTIKRVVTNTPLDNGTVYYLHDRSGNVIAELDSAGATAREYIWLPEAGYAGTDMPLAVVDGVNTASPQLYYVHTDHINRPIRMSTTAKVMVWQAEWNPWGGPQSLTGALAQNLRFPGQWFQIETGLHYNWHRHYDPTIGRYTQPDPLGFVDGPSVYAYAKGSPQRWFDPDGLSAGAICAPGGPVAIGVCSAVIPPATRWLAKKCFSKIKEWVGPPPGNFNCPPGKCCLSRESVDSRGQAQCHYECGKDGRTFSWPKDTKHIPCVSEVVDLFNPPWQL